MNQTCQLRDETTSHRVLVMSQDVRAHGLGEDGHALTAFCPSGCGIQHGNTYTPQKSTALLSSDPLPNLCGSAVSWRADSCKLHFPDSLVNRLPAWWTVGGAYGRQEDRKREEVRGLLPRSLGWVVSSISFGISAASLASELLQQAPNMLSAPFWRHRLLSVSRTLSSLQSCGCFLPTIISGLPLTPHISQFSDSPYAFSVIPKTF